MKNIQDIHWNEWRWLARHYNQYVLVMVIFAVFIFYTVAVITKEPPKKSKSSSTQSTDRISWDITTEKSKKTFTNVLQGRSGDWYRMGVSTVANHAARINVILYSAFNEDVSIGFFRCR